MENGDGGLGSGGCSSMPVVQEVDDDEEECSELEPFFFDEAEAVADHERRVRREQEEARKEEQRVWAAKVRAAVLDSIRDYDPKQGGEYYNRFYYADFSEFDLDEESPLAPMRYTDRVWNKGDRYRLCYAVNILSVKIVSLDVSFPIHVYGTVIARDSLDRKCVYLFRREKDCCQRITPEDVSLILTGPKRGLALIGDVNVEIDLKIKNHEGQEKELSKGVCNMGGISRLRLLDECYVDNEDLATRLSTVEVMHSFVKAAVEATIAVEVLGGEFNGKITACTTSIPNQLVLHDSKVADVVNNGNDRGVIHLLRSVVCVCLEEELLVTIVDQTGDGESVRTEAFSANINGGREVQITVGVSEMLVKVSWSLIHHQRKQS